MAPYIHPEAARDARRVYLWLLFAPIVAVPCWLTLLFSASTTGPGEYLGAAIVPMVFYAPLFFWAFNEDPFLRVHARQGLVLLGLRAVSPLLAFGLFGQDLGTVVFILVVNGSLWLFGSLIGLRQVSKRRSTFNFDPGELPPADEPSPARKRTPHDLLAQIGPLRQQGRRAEAVAILLEGFRSDDQAVREIAERVLGEMGEVETF